MLISHLKKSWCHFNLFFISTLTVIMRDVANYTCTIFINLEKRHIKSSGIFTNQTLNHSLVLSSPLHLLLLYDGCVFEYIQVLS